MEKEIYSVKYVSEFLQKVVHPLWIKEGKLLRHRPIAYDLMRVKNEKKRSYIFVLDFTNSVIKHNIDKIEFKVTRKSFKSAEQDFSDLWQQYQIAKENVQTI